MIAKDLIPGMGIGSFAIMERPPETRPGRQFRAGLGNSQGTCRRAGDDLPGQAGRLRAGRLLPGRPLATPAEPTRTASAISRSMEPIGWATQIELTRQL